MKAVLYLFLFLSTYTLQAQQFSTQDPLVTVTGEGEVNVAPDGVLIKSRIEHEGQDPQEVKKKNDAVVSKVIHYLKGQGIPSKNVQTDYVILNKNYNYDSKTYSYFATQAISIKLENLRDYEKLMSWLLQAGLNRIDGVEFQTSKLEIIKTEARKNAMLNARSKAKEYAEALGQQIGKAVLINESVINDYPPVYRMSEMMKSSGDGAVEETLAPGEMVIKAKVTVGFLLL